jgi:hypothetical protein
VCDGSASLFNGHSTIIASDGGTSQDGNGYQSSPARCDVTVGLVGSAVPTADLNLLPAGGRTKGPYDSIRHNDACRNDLDA